MTKSFLGHGTHSEIIKAFNQLEQKGLIKKLSECKFSRGRKQYYYKITEKGIELLITDDPHPLKFWKILFGYCHYNDKGLTRDKINEFYNLFIQRYLKYKNTGFSFQLDIFDNTREQWLGKIKNNSDEITVDQSIIEVLAICPRITFEELAKKAGVTENEVKKCLANYTLEAYNLLDDKTAYIHQNVTGKKYNKKYWDFLLHNTIVSRRNNNTKVYELSLFGIILALTVIRFKDQGKLGHQLYYQDLSLVEYYSKIAHNYKKKLPLIFGKWRLLTDILGLFSAYIFDVILDKEMRINDSDKLSVIRGGNKELSDGAREIVYQTRQQIGALADMGMAVWLNYRLSLPYEFKWQKKIPKVDYLLANDVDVNTHPELERTHGLKEKLDEIIWILNPLEEDHSQVEIGKFSGGLEKQLEDEITALYYFQLYFDYEFNARISESLGHYYSTNFTEFAPKSLWPKECLSLLMKNDVDKPLLSEWFYEWMEKINRLQTEIHNAVPKRPI
jgi:predicted transcriptional regulator